MRTAEEICGKMHAWRKYQRGHTRNIYFPFDIINDTAIEVSIEMVKELDISDWEPLEIAEMIEEEISTLVPTWKDRTTTQFNRQRSFISEDDYDQRLKLTLGNLGVVINIQNEAEGAPMSTFAVSCCTDL